MEGFSEKDAENVQRIVRDGEDLQRIKDAMARKAQEGDPSAAGAFAALVNAQTRREELASKPAPDTTTTTSAPTSWQETVTARRQANAGPELAS
jgi:hypothetical protein